MTAALLGLGGLAGVALHASDLPAGWAWALTPVVLAYAAWQAHLEWSKPLRTLAVTAMTRDAANACAGADVPPGFCLDGRPLVALEVTWRGNAAFLRGREEGGRCFRAVVWPDATTEHQRRELRLAQFDRATSPSRPSMAP